MRVPERERGAALLAVLVLVAVMGAMAAAAFDRLRISTALATNSAQLDQARAYAVGLESLLTLRIDDMNDEAGDRTPTEDGWNGSVRSIALPGGLGSARASIRDAGNCFNLNGLVQSGGDGVLTARPRGVAAFTRLMIALGTPDQQAAGIAAAAADWADSDSEPLPRGAEDGAYAGESRPYRAANTLFAEASELRAVAGVSADAYARIRPFVCALPVAEPSPMNVNTVLPSEAALLVVLAPDSIAPDRARRIVAERPAGGWRTIADFWRTPSLRGRRVEMVTTPDLVTRWFGLDLEVSVGDTELTETALIDARYATSTVAARRWTSDE
ncbi:MAG: general secretion pathway protein GspK [Alphaproteobacteria bacterium]|nr:MAG: general secretion pathway protein GspK [Alphaproteobacteria bacterium]